MKTFGAHNSSYQSLYFSNAQKVCPVRIYSTAAKYKKKNQSNYCESKLKLSKEFTSSDKLLRKDADVLAKYKNLISGIIEERKLGPLTFSRIYEYKISLSRLEKKTSRIFMRTYKPNVCIMTAHYAIKYFKEGYSDCRDPDVVIIDEGGQMSLLNFIFLAARFPNSKFVIFGDTKQLSPYIQWNMLLMKNIIF
uniref:AAA_11 domain-containing protein n=1 Tax=Strongyloides papillosus TaxID=174720 RepID=A0A0N5C986_STREA